MRSNLSERVVMSSSRLKEFEDSNLDEVDEFHDERDKILFNEAGSYTSGLQNDNDISSDEEVLGLDEESNDDVEYSDSGNEEINNEVDQSEESEVEAWGGRKDYYGGDEAEDTEMAQEAIRLQKKHLAELSVEDYVDEDLMDDWEKIDGTKMDSEPTALLSTTSDIGSLSNMQDKEKEQILNTMFPEFKPILKEMNNLKLHLESLNKGPVTDASQLKKVALSSYISSLALYFALFMERLNSKGQLSVMKDEPIMETILQSREVWKQANEIPNDFVPKSEIIADEVAVSEMDVSNSSSEELHGEINPSSSDSGSDDDVNESSSEEEFDIDIKKKREINPKALPRGRDHIESENVDEVDLEDKIRRKKSLRFYTAKIDKASNKNNTENSGDMDLPYRERLFERQQRLIEEARKRGLGLDKNNLGDNLDDNSASEQDTLYDKNESNTVGDEYYQKVKQEKLNRKDSRRTAHQAALSAAREGKLQELAENVDENGKRAINYQILKNKGLTPHRNKDNRNSRVKKRKKYEKAQKKLKSVRQVYTDPSSRGSYQGESTGIKKNLSRSVRLA